MSDPKKDLYLLFDQLFKTPRQQRDQFSLYRLHHLLDSEPASVLETLFFDYHWRQQQIGYNNLKSFLLKHDLIFCPALLKFAVPLERNFFLACLERDFFSQQASFMGKLRNLLKDVLRHSLKKTGKESQAIEKTLRNMAHTDCLTQQLKENLRIPFDCLSVLEEMELYLKDAAIIADLPQFRCTYFSPDQLAGLAPLLEQQQWTPFLSLHLKRLLTPAKKEQIRQVLKTIIESSALPSVTKQSFALYLTLTDEVDWQHHPFIRRLLHNSYWHNKVETVKLTTT